MINTQQRRSNPILGDDSPIKPRGIRTYSKYDNIANNCSFVNEEKRKSVSKYIIPDHSYNYFHPIVDLSRQSLKKTPSTFQPTLNQKDPLSRKISNIYSQDFQHLKQISNTDKCKKLTNPSDRRIMDNKSSIQQETSPYDNKKHSKTQGSSFPSDVNWFYVDTIKHRHDYQIKQQDQVRSSLKDQRSSMDAHQYLKNVKKSELVKQYNKQ